MKLNVTAFLKRKCVSNGTLSEYVRFADDFVVILDDKNLVDKVHEIIKEALTPLYSKLNLEK